MAATDLEPRDSAPDRPMTPLPIALATSSPERRQRNLARGIAETLDDSIELARRFRERHGAGQPHVGGVRAPIDATLDDSKRLAERFSERTQHDIATTLEESRQLAERWRARTAPSVARTLAESYDLARRFQRGQLRPAEPYRPPLPQGRPLLPRTLDDSLAFAARRPTATTSASLADAKAAAARFGARYNVSELVKGPLLRGPTDVNAPPTGPRLTVKTGGGGPSGPGGAPLGAPDLGGQGTNTAPAFATGPIAFRNALWTRFDPPDGVRITDIAAGRRYVSGQRVVWATGTDADTGPALGLAFQLRPGGRFDVKTNVQSAGTLHVVAARDTGDPFLFGGSPVMWRASEPWDGWDIVPWTSYDHLTDMAVGKLADPYEPKIWWVDDTGQLYEMEYIGVAPHLELVSRFRASNIARVSVDVDGNLWTVDRNGRVLRGTSFEPVSPYGFARDVAAAPGGDAYVIGTERASDAVTGTGTVPAAGNEIWWWNHLTATWTKVDPGWGVAIDVDDDGALWVVDDQGRVWSRGENIAGLWPYVTRVGPDANDWKPPFEAAGLAGTGGLMRLWHWSVR